MDRHLSAIAGLAIAGDRIHGTAWLFCESLALTARHCVIDPDCGQPLREPLELRFFHPQPLTLPVARLHLAPQAQCAGFDVALLELAAPTAQPALPSAVLPPFTQPPRWRGYGFPQAHPTGMPLTGEVQSRHGNLAPWPALQLGLDQGGYGRMKGISGGPVVVRGCAVGVIRYAPPELADATLLATSMADIADIFAPVRARLPQRLADPERRKLQLRIEKLPEVRMFELVDDLKYYLRDIPQLGEDAPNLPALVAGIGGDGDARSPAERLLDYFEMRCPNGVKPILDLLAKM